MNRCVGADAYLVVSLRDVSRNCKCYALLRDGIRRVALGCDLMRIARFLVAVKTRAARAAEAGALISSL